MDVSTGVRTLLHRFLLASICVASPALADDSPPASDGAPSASAPSDERTAADVAEDPLPGNESGRVDGTRDRDSVLRDIGQGVLLVPRVALEASTAPVRATLWAFDRYHLLDRWKRLFFDDTYTYGLYPTAVLDSSYG
ncbi:MAG TPA: hypothetical protein VFS15_29765, partial [Kofleriaceae bacterium]|nr:hypothetical protein [Kofleriaceae bacterium]